MSLDIPVDPDFPDYTLSPTGDSGSNSLSSLLDDPLDDLAIPPLTLDQDYISSNGLSPRDLGRVSAGFSPLLSLESISQFSNSQSDPSDALVEAFENPTSSAIDPKRAKQLEQLEVLKMYQCQLQEHIETL